MDKPVSFRIAKLAKIKEYKETCYSAYSIWRDNIRRTQTEEQALESYDIEREPSYTGDEGYYTIKEYFQGPDYTLAPTSGDLREWLWEKFGVIVSVDFKTKWTFFSTVKFVHNDEVVSFKSDTYNSKKEAEEEGLILALNKLILEPNPEA